ncbi:restriction endonuclease subunit S [Streptomyces sp. SudanB135_2055]|uniref:restriction endonuclease subunit S n=1 Tax=Streptomyces sp. SudanB135_2055 TaxID=3035279 RepID=UPI0036DCD537
MSIPSELPEGWVRVRLDQVAEVRLGRQRSPKNHIGTHMRPYLRAANVDWNGLKLDDVKEMNFTDDELAVYRLKKGDIVLSEASGSPSEVGKPAIWNDEIADCCLQNTLIRVRSHGVDPNYLFHFLRSEAIRGAFVEHSRGVGIHHIGSARLAAWQVPVPPLEEQQRIVAALEEQLSRLDAAVGNAVEVRKKLLAYKASRELEIVPSPKSRTGEQVLPDGWRMVRLSDISHSSGYGTSAKCGYEGDGSAVLRIPNIQSGSIDPDDLKYALDVGLDLNAYKVKAGDLLVVRTNGSRDLIGRVAVSHEDTEYAFASYLIRFKIKTEIASPDWVARVLSTRPWRRLIEAAAASTAGQYNLNLKKLGSLPIVLPPVEQQLSLTVALDEIDESVRRLTSAVDDASLKGEALRRSLLTEAFAGRLVSQNPADESIEALLDRIRTEREAAGAAKSRRRSPRRAPAQRKRTPDTGPAPDVPLPARADAPATATQPTLDLEMPS